VRRSTRELALCPVFLRLGAYDILRVALRSMALDADASAAGVALATAELEVASEQPQEALRHYRAVSYKGASAQRELSAHLGQAAVLAGLSDYDGAREAIASALAITRKLKLGRRRRSLAFANCYALRARMGVMSDNETRARSDYARARRSALASGDIEAIIGSHVFGGDALRSHGDYRGALRMLDAVFDNNAVFSSERIRGYGYFYRGLTRCAMGDLDKGLPDIERSEHLFTLGHNQLGAAWSAVAAAGYLRVVNLADARDALMRCEAALAHYPGPAVQCQARLIWERAEHARASGSSTATIDGYLDSLGELLHRHPNISLPYMAAHILSIRAEIARERHTRDAVPLLNECISRYRQGKWRACEARMRVALGLAKENPPTSGLIDMCRREGYGFELARLEGRTSGYYALHVL
jgi:tetratricopeptide (TPR) repeat protein